MNTKQKILEYLKKRERATNRELSDMLGITTRGVRKQLKALLDSKEIVKIGLVPKVLYELNTNYPILVDILPSRVRNELKNYLYITPLGLPINGSDGFITWCSERKLNPAKQAQAYLAAIAKIDASRVNGLIDGSSKLANTFENVLLDKLFYVDFYSIPIFGKTKIGQLLLYAKQSQNIKQIKNVIMLIRPAVIKLINEMHIEAVGFIPPTIKRETQFMKELQRYLSLDIPTIKLTKAKTEIIIPQKTLTKLNDRILNARKTILVEEAAKYKNILLIDDAVGSGATLNETARAIRAKGISSGQLIGLAIAGSYKGFDVISEI